MTSFREKLLNHSLIQVLIQYDWIVWAAIAALVTGITLSVWAFLIVWIAWAAWRIWINWEMYILGVDNIYNLILALRKGKFVLKKSSKIVDARSEDIK